MTDMLELAWDRCPECLGLLDAVDVDGAAALGCVECSYVGDTVCMPPAPYPFNHTDLGFPGF